MEYLFMALAGGAGLFLVIGILADGFETIILPRTVGRRIRFTRWFYRNLWGLWSIRTRRIEEGSRRETHLSIFGPMSLLLLLAVWALGLILGFALLQFALGSAVHAPEAHPNFASDLYFSGVTFFTLGYGDIVPRSWPARSLAMVETGFGFGFLALVIGYLPVLYQAFSKREVSISLLDARASSPPTAVELLRRHSQGGYLPALNPLLQEWERWSAELLESHLSYPVLTYYRSQHDHESWLAALTAILDTCTLMIVGLDGLPAWQARLTFAMARHAIIDICLVFNIAPAALDPDRMAPEETQRIRAALADAGIALHEGSAADQKLTELRRQYEPYVNAFAQFLFVSLPPWMPQGKTVDNWQTSAWKGDHF